MSNYPKAITAAIAIRYILIFNFSVKGIALILIIVPHRLHILMVVLKKKQANSSPALHRQS